VRHGRAKWASESMGLLAEREQALRSALDLVIARRRWQRAELEQFQLSTLQKLLTYATAHVPLYREKYAAVKFNPTDIQSLAELSRIPALTKAELRHADLASLAARDCPTRRQLLSSSGSTGTPSRLFRDEDSLWQFSAYDLALFYDWCAGTPLTNGLYILDLSAGSIDAALADHLRTTVPVERILSITWPNARLLEKLQQCRPEFVSTYPSTIRNLAFLLQRSAQICPTVKLIHLTSEMCDAGTRKLLAQVFPQARLMETYTSTEAGLVAFRCPAANAWHVAEELSIVEIVDDAGKPTAEVGRVMVTNLTNWSTPVIRYDGLGDYARWGAGLCRCGSPLRTIEQFEGRHAESLIRPDGSLLTPYVLTNALEELPGLAQFQVIQRAPTELEVLLIPEAGADTASDRWAADIRPIFQRLLAPTVQVAVRVVPQIPPRPGSHKTPLVISEIQTTPCATT